MATPSSAFEMCDESPDMATKATFIDDPLGFQNSQLYLGMVRESSAVKAR